MKKTKLLKKDLLGMAVLSFDSAVELTKSLFGLYKNEQLDLETYKYIVGVISLVVNNFGQYEEIYKNDTDMLTWVKTFEEASKLFIKEGKENGFISKEDLVEN